MRVNANSLSTNLFVTGLVLCLVVLLPFLDTHLSHKLGLNLQGGVSRNKRADGLLKLRTGILYAVFGIYVLSVIYLVLFSRSASKEYQVHVALFEDLKRSIHIDFGALDFFRIAFSEGFPAALSHIQVISPEDITQVYMNIMLFVPMGYLLPYIFPFFQTKVRIRPALCSCVISFLIENIQLVTRRGFYDMDDLVSNTIGGIIGQILFMVFGYVVTHPSWRKELEGYRRWKRNARRRTLYPFARKMGLTRTTLYASDEETVWDFYVMKLGFRLKRQIVPVDSPKTDMLLEMGKLQVEVHCTNGESVTREQELCMACAHLAPVVHRLHSNGIETSEPEQDIYTGLRCIHFQGPDQIRITVIEERV